MKDEVRKGLPPLDLAFLPGIGSLVESCVFSVVILAYLS
jgi:hypothetical protein